MKYRGFYSLTLLSDQGNVAKSEQSADYEVDEFEHPGGRLRKIALAEMEKQHAVGFSINEYSEIVN